MKIAFSLKNKLKIAFLLFCIASCSLLINFLEERSVSKMNKAFISMYRDRLVPATDLFLISEQLRQKNELWQDAFMTNGATEFSNKHLVNRRQYDLQVDAALKKYEATKLVPKEVYHLVEFKKALIAQNEQEKLLLNIYRNDAERARKMYRDTNRVLIQNTLSSLSNLIKIQSVVGDELINDSEALVSGTKLYSTIQIFLSIAIGLLVVAIVGTSNAVKMRNNNFNLN